MEPEQAFWMQAKLAAANLALDIIVEKDGRMSLRHKKAWGDPERPSDGQVATFRAFLARNRAMILKVHCIDNQDPVATDARRLKDWLLAQNSAENCLIRSSSGREYLYGAERDRLLKNYREDGAWVLEAFRFQSAVQNPKSWKDPKAEVPDIWK